MNQEPIIDPIDKRKYIRMSVNFPVDFTIVRLQGDLPGLNWQEGHTYNVSEGGICLETDTIDESTIKYLSASNIYLDMRIKFPDEREVVRAVGEVIWFNKLEESRFMVGMKFRSITTVDLKKIIKLAKKLR